MKADRLPLALFAVLAVSGLAAICAAYAYLLTLADLTEGLT
jgi:hypothetical protein